MLVLSRKEGERIRIGDDIVITVVRTGSDKVRIGVEAPSTTVILRDELKPQPTENAPPLGGIISSMPSAALNVPTFS